MTNTSQWSRFEPLSPFACEQCEISTIGLNQQPGTIDLTRFGGPENLDHRLGWADSCTVEAVNHGQPAADWLTRAGRRVSFGALRAL